MLKNFLKSSVGALILVSLIAQPSLAGNGGLGGEENPDKKDSGRRPKKVLEGKKESKGRPKKALKTHGASPSLNFEEVAKGSPLPNYSEFYTLLSGNKDMLKRILLTRGVDQPTLQNTALVCKEWNHWITDLITGKESVFKMHLRNPIDDKNPNKFLLHIKNLNDFFVHPSVFEFAHKELAGHFPHQLIYQAFMQDAQTGKPIALVDYEVPQIIDNYISVIKLCPTSYPSLCNQFIHLDPLNYMNVALAAHMIKQFPSAQNPLQKLLEEAVSENSFEYSKFPKLIKDQANYPSMKRHLMALKLLTLSNDPIASEQMNDFTTVLAQNNHYSMQDPTFLLGSFWSAYTVKTGLTINSDGNLIMEYPFDLECLHLGELMYDNQAIKFFPILDRLEQFVNYAEALSNVASGLFESLETLRSCQTGYYQSSQQRISELDDEYKSIDKKNCFQLDTIARAYAENRQYDQALRILEEALENVGKSPFKFQILFDIAEFILESDNKDNLQKAARSFDIVQQEFAQRQQSILDTTFTFGTDEEKEIINWSIHVLDLLEVNVALKIALGGFDDAYTLIIENDLTNETDLDSRAIKVALQSQLHHLPKKLKKVFVKEFTNFSKDFIERPHMRQELHEFEALYTDFAKEAKRKNKKQYKKVMKENQQMIAQHTAQVENQDEGQKPAQENKPGSKKKDKKDKNDKKKK